MSKPIWHPSTLFIDSGYYSNLIFGCTTMFIDTFEQIISISIIKFFSFFVFALCRYYETVELEYLC